MITKYVINFFEKFRKQTEMPQKKPSKNEVWYIKNKTPWPKNEVKVKIIDCKRGWVRYSFGVNGIFNDERMKLNTFTNCYKLLDA